MNQTAKNSGSVIIAMSAMGNDLFRRYMKSKYTAALRRAGAQVREVSAEDDLEAVVAACDGLLLPGGADIDPGLYGQSPTPACGQPSAARDALEFPLLKAFLDADKPVFGICRGAQVLNVALGGTMHQDIKQVQEVNHADFFSRARSAHGISVHAGTRLSQVLGNGAHRVNSIHHQAMDTIGEGLIVSAVSEDGFAEALELPRSRFCLGVQWHPEHMAPKNPAQQALFQAFVDACRER